MRAITLRTKTVLAALAGAGILALGTAAAVPATGLHQALVHGNSSHSRSVLADDRGPGLVHS
ncbi:hypothetical protein FRZ03_22845 [Streptomyces misionensis]|uniref:Uncharacterized protein n=1 Tax=Streptomyces misionensis TaxID=67331 RepID=A0A5C6JFQ6_9ACTN|nr:hypothetical protein [Streptomyces misionensis]TWV39955.1 hypothetical protein FRZ03_22845 [Streptomyces misionensis]